MPDALEPLEDVDPWRDLGYDRPLPDPLSPPLEPCPPPWAGQDWRHWAGHVCDDHDEHISSWKEVE